LSRSRISSLLPMLAASVILAGCQTDKPASAATKQDAKPKQVRVVPAEQRAVNRAIETTGTLGAQDQVLLAMKVTGRIADLTVDLGDRVRKGQVIAQLETTDLRLGVEQAAAALLQARTRLGLPAEGEHSQVDVDSAPIVVQARAALNEATLNRDRAQKLFDEKLIARSDLDRTLAAYQIAEGQHADALEEIRNRQAILAQRHSELALARQRLRDATLRSPIDGAVVERQASVGQYLAAGTPVVNVVKIHPLRLRMPVPERVATDVRTGQHVRVTVDGDPNVYSGRVTRLSPAIDESNRTLLVEAEIPNERGLLRPGTFARAELITETDRPSVFIPAGALVTFAGLEKVITVENGKSVEKLVKTGRKDGDDLEILEGLSAGEQVVVRPGNLVGGQPVLVTQAR
jgi:RND family efflux transporter MFP subunit